MKRFKAIESNRPIEDQRYRTKYHGSSESIAKDWKFLDDIYLITTQQPVSYENVVFLKMCNLSAHFEVNERLDRTKEELEKVNLWDKVKVCFELIKWI